MNNKPPRFEDTDPIEEVPKFEDTDPINESVSLKSPEIPEEKFSELEALERGGEQGLSFGLSDEIRGALGGSLLGGAKTAVGGLLGSDLSADQDVQAYKEARDIERSKLKLAQEQHPGFYTGGEIGGAILPMFLTGGGSAAARGAVAAGELAESAKVAQSIKNAAKLGGLAAAGTSEADLSQGEVGGFAKDVATGAALGGALDVGFYGLGKGIGKIKESQPVQDFLKSRQIGLAGESLIGREPREKIGQEVIDMARSTGTSLSDKLKQSEISINKAIKASQERGETVNVDSIMNFIDETLPPDLKSDPDAYKLAKDKLLEPFRRLTTEPIPVKMYAPEITKVPAKEGTKEILEKKAALDRINAKQMGVDLETTITETVDDMGNPVLVYQKITREPVSGAEKAIGPKVMGTYPNSPEGLASAQGRVSELRGKATIEGLPDPQMHVVDDLQEGWYRAVSRQEPGIEQIKDPYKQSITSKAFPMEQAVPEQELLSLQPMGEQTFQIPSSMDIPIEEAVHIKRNILGDIIEDQNLPSSIKNVADRVRGKLADEINTTIPSIGAANQRYITIKEALEELNKTTRLTEEGLQEGIIPTIQRAGSTTTASDIARDNLKNALNKLRTGGEDLKQLADAIESSTANLSEKYELVRKIANSGGMGIQSKVLQSGNIAGLVQRRSGQILDQLTPDAAKQIIESLKKQTAPIGKFASEKAQILKDKMPQQAGRMLEQTTNTDIQESKNPITQLIGKIESSDPQVTIQKLRLNPATAGLAEQLEKAIANRKPQEKAAAQMAIAQNPQAREVLREQ